jgi:hypothetical protein
MLIGDGGARVASTPDNGKYRTRLPLGDKDKMLDVKCTWLSSRNEGGAIRAWSDEEEGTSLSLITEQPLYLSSALALTYLSLSLERTSSHF